MLRIGHRQSKDIDLFVPDPQYLGYVNPRLSEEAEQVSADYSENAEFIKFFLPTGEIDIVVGTALTEQPFEQVAYAGRDIKLETCGEIIAKKCGIGATKPRLVTCLTCAQWRMPSRRPLARLPRFWEGTAQHSCSV